MSTATEKLLKFANEFPEYSEKKLKKSFPCPISVFDDFEVFCHEKKVNLSELLSMILLEFNTKNRDEIDKIKKDQNL